MEVRYQVSPAETAGMMTSQLRDHFAIENLMQKNSARLVYSHYDRMIVGGIVPGQSDISLETYPPLKAEFFLERREMGVINVGGAGTIEVEGKMFPLAKLDCLYIGKGNKKVVFHSDSSFNPARYYLLSAPAHREIPVQLMTSEKASPGDMGSAAMANERRIYKYIHDAGLQSCQLVMGLTILKEGSVWNTMPAHTHDRRMEVYFYFDVPEGQKVFHFMGQPRETRHLLLGNYDAVLSPPWSIHAGCGTASYAFIWGMAGENYTYTDMDPVPVSELL